MQQGEKIFVEDHSYPGSHSLHARKFFHREVVSRAEMNDLHGLEIGFERGYSVTGPTVYIKKTNTRGITVPKAWW